MSAQDRGFTNRRIGSSIDDQNDSLSGMSTQVAANLWLFWNRPELWEQYGVDACYIERKRTVESLLPAGVKSILDVGSGKGEIVNNLHRDYQAVALDVSQIALTHVRCPRVLGTIEALPFADQSFNLVICLEVIEHLPDAAFRHGIQELQRVSENWMIVGVPYRENLCERTARCPSCRGYIHADTHFRRFESAEQLAGLFPQFCVKSHTLTGPFYRRSTRLGLCLQQRIGQIYLPWQPDFVCTWCGFVKSDLGSQELRLYGRAFRRINAWLSHFNRPLPYWLIVLLQRV
jgi:SAM-dependent methyltransferase